ncbi:MAG: SHOCT domain-containing protein [Thermodesulfobacteriota bacterium]
MKIYLELFLMMMTGLLVSCAGEGYYGPQGRGGWNHMMGYGGFGGIFMWIILIVIAAVIIYFVINRSKTTGDSENSTGESPTEILKKRYAKGEITKEEFDRVKKEIES